MIDDSLHASAITTAGSWTRGGGGPRVRGTREPESRRHLSRQGRRFFTAVMIVANRIRALAPPFPRFGSANQITTVRVVLLALVASLMGEPAVPPVDAGAAATAAAASISVALLDGVDGWLARRTRMSSAFGARFDMETDALLILVLGVLAWQYGKAGAWVLTSGLLDTFSSPRAGCSRGWPPVAPSRRGRVICVVQIVTLSLAIVPRSYRPPARCWQRVGCWRCPILSSSTRCGFGGAGTPEPAHARTG